MYLCRLTFFSYIMQQSRTWTPTLPFKHIGNNTDNMFKVHILASFTITRNRFLHHFYKMSHMDYACLYLWNISQGTKRVEFDSLGLICFAIGLVTSIGGHVPRSPQKLIPWCLQVAPLVQVFSFSTTCTPKLLPPT